MIGLDTNILVRLIVRDDKTQEKLAEQLVATLSPQRRAHVGLLVVSELAWVLERTYKLGRDVIAEAIGRLLRSADIVVERAELVEWALEEYTRQKSDLADVLIAEINRQAGCEATYTFDKQAARGRMTLLEPAAKP